MFERHLRLAAASQPGFLAAVMIVGATASAAPPESAPPLVVDESEITASDRDHWSYRPLQCPAVPVPNDAGWCRTPVDRFLRAEMDRKGLRPAAEAARTILLRRLSFDLVGLPPTPADIAEFLADSRPDAYERRVDRLLESPAYGERWAQHWLDLARFAETDGFEHDKVRPGAWRYRDWVIAALNEDLPYDRFVALQIAADELNEQTAAAGAQETENWPTAFCLSGPDMPDLNSQEERRHVLLNELTSTVGSVLLGLQFGCAQCHDHKYDPISLGDFYRLRAFFDPSVAVQRDKLVSALPVADGVPAASRLYLRGDWRTPGPGVEPAFPRISNPWGELVSVEARSTRRGRRRELARWLTRPDHPLVPRVMANRLWQYHFGVGLSLTPSDFGILGDEPLHGQLLDWLACELVRSGWSLKRMHRLIVTSATYRQASQPESQPAVPVGASSTTAVAPAITLKDAENRYFARFPRRRLSGEELRDALLVAADVLQSERGGPGTMPPLPAELSQTLLKGQWSVSRREADHYRRSIYVFARRNLRYPIFEVFDRPDGNASCPQRSRTTTAPQSLHLLNSQLALDAARRLAGAVLAESDQPDDHIRLAVLRVLGRPPRLAEQVRLQAFLTSQQEVLKRQPPPVEGRADPLPAPRSEATRSKAARSKAAASEAAHYGAAFTDLCLALFNLSEFLYVE